MSICSGPVNSVARPDQYTPSRDVSPTAARAVANASVAPTGTSRPSPRNTAANATATRSAPGSGMARRGLDQCHQAVRPYPLLVFAVLHDRPERGGNRLLVESRPAECGERLGPVDGFGHTGRLVQLQAPKRFDRG